MADHCMVRAVTTLFALLVFVKVVIDWGVMLRIPLELPRDDLSGAAAVVLRVPILKPLRTVINYRYGTTPPLASKVFCEGAGWTRYSRGLTLLDRNKYSTSWTSPPRARSRIPPRSDSVFPHTFGHRQDDDADGQKGEDGDPALEALYVDQGLQHQHALIRGRRRRIREALPIGTYNHLDETLPLPTTAGEKLLQKAFIGSIASVVLDSVSNSLGVVKTCRQVRETRIGYGAAAEAAVTHDGLRGMLERGLKARVLRMDYSI